MLLLLQLGCLALAELFGSGLICQLFALAGRVLHVLRGVIFLWCELFSVRTWSVLFRLALGGLRRLWELLLARVFGLV